VEAVPIPARRSSPSTTCYPHSFTNALEVKRLGQSLLGYRAFLTGQHGDPENSLWTFRPNKLSILDLTVKLRVLIYKSILECDESVSIHNLGAHCAKVIFLDENNRNLGQVGAMVRKSGIIGILLILGRDSPRCQN